MNTTTSCFIGAPRNCLRSVHGGFSLVEMLAVLVIVSLLLGAGAPSLMAWLDSIKLTAASNDFLSHLYLARGEAIKRQSRVVLCKSTDGVLCADTGGWEQGWIIFHDANNNGRREINEKLVQHEQALSSSLKLTGNQNVAKYVSFTPSGGTRLVGGGFQAGTLTVCKHSAEKGEARQIILNAVGRPRVQKATVTSCA